MFFCTTSFSRYTPPVQTFSGKALTLGQGTLTSRLLGFVRDAVIAALLGGGWMADALLLSFRIPNCARALLAEGAFAYTLVPAYSSLKKVDPERAWAFIRSMTVAVILFFSLFVLAGALFSDHIAIILAPGFYDMPDVLALASGFMALCLFSLPSVSGAAVSAAALLAEGHVRPVAYGSAVFNLLVILSAGLAFFLCGGGDSRAPYMLCGGVIVAGIVQWGYQTFFLCRSGFSLRGPLAFKDSLLRRSLRTLPRSVFGVSGHQANLFLAAFLASFLAEGSISALYFAERLLSFPLGIIGASMGLAALSDLSRRTPSFSDAHGADGHGLFFTDREQFGRRLVSANRITLFFALPAAVGLACLAKPLISLIFGYGEFDDPALLRTSNALLAYILGLPALALVRPLLAGLAALGCPKPVSQGALAGFAATLLFGLLSLPFESACGPALAVSCGAWVNAAVLLHALGKLGYAPLPGLAWPVKVLVACALMGACVLWTAALFDAALGKALGVPLGIGVYMGLTSLFRIPESALTLRVVVDMRRNKT